jgi:hypothetical protein
MDYRTRREILRTCSDLIREAQQELGLSAMSNTTGIAYPDLSMLKYRLGEGEFGYSDVEIRAVHQSLDIVVRVLKDGFPYDMRTRLGHDVADECLSLHEEPGLIDEALRVDEAHIDPDSHRFK